MGTLKCGKPAVDSRRETRELQPVSVCVLLTIHPGCDAGDPPEGTRKVCRTAVAQLFGNIGYFYPGVLQHLAGRMETRVRQHLDIASA